MSSSFVPPVPVRADGNQERISSKRLEDPLLRLVEHRPDLCPLGQAVGDHQGEGVFAAGDAAIMTDQIGADLAGPGVLPLGEGADRDLVDQTRGRLGRGATA